MNKIILIILFFAIPLCTFSQQFSNNWINYSQSYYKISITEEGIYRISKSVLIAAGFDFSSFHPRNLQLFCKGEEQFIYVFGEDDGLFDQGDYIEFYAKPNAGELDTMLYKNNSHQINPYYSLINDTNAYFLTYNNSLNNRRLSIETDTDFASHSPALSYCMKEVFQMYVSDSTFGAQFNGPYYTQGEGWFDFVFGKGCTNLVVIKSLNTPNPYTSGPASELLIASVGVCSNNHHLLINLPESSFDTTFTGYKNMIKQFTFPSSSLTNNYNILFTIIDDVGAATDFHRISYIKLSYPHTYDFENQSSFKFIVPDHYTGKSYLAVSNFIGGSSPVLYDIDNHKRINTINSSGEYHCLIPNSSGNKTCLFISEGAIKTVNSLKKMNFTDYSVYGFNSDYIIISHPKLWSSAQAYTSYRNISGYNSLLVDINQLYDQFSYGIYKHPASIRNFINYISSIYDSVPEHLFLLGKARNSPDLRDFSSYSNCLVPSFGNKSSDILLTAGLGNTIFEPLISTGRLATTNPADVDNYLQKVIDYEQNTAAEWMKNVVHFAGGSDSNEQDDFLYYLNQYKTIIEDTLFGGYVSTIKKYSSDPMTLTQLDSVESLINTGVSIMTFFGHGSSSGFDVNIENPEYFNNYQKYPMILANSCLAGDIHLQSTGISESWVFEPNKGSIGFIASVDQSIESYLHLYSNELYKQIALKNYNKPIGSSMKNTIAVNQVIYGYNEGAMNTFHEFTLHGDPAIVINSQDLPDYVVTTGNISFIPEIISSELDSFEVVVVVTNIGKAINHPIFIKLEREFNDGSKDIYYSSSICYYKDTLKFKLPLNSSKGIGMNTICVYADALNDVLELSELNNNACIQFNILSSDLIPVFPYEFAIYPNNSTKLKASTGNPFLVNQTSKFEIDTTDLFNSNQKYSTILTHNGGIVEWLPPFTFTDSTVYFWRVGKVPPSGGVYNWKESSFIYIPQKTGWSQAHHFQFKKDDYTYIEYDKMGRRFDYIITPKSLHCRNIGSAELSQWQSIIYEIDLNIRGKTSCCARSAIIVAVIDPISIDNWMSNKQDYGHGNYPNCWECNSGTPPANYFVFYNDSASIIANLTNMTNLINAVPENYHILMYSFISGNLSIWPEVAYQAIESLHPATGIRTHPYNFPYIFYAQKGNPLSGDERIGDSPTDTIDFYVDLITNYTKGDINSTLIGPSTYWETLHWKQLPDDYPNYDSLSLTITGVKLSGDTDLVMTIPADTTDIYDLYSHIDGNTYPYLYMNLFAQDDSLKTPAQLKKWQLTYELSPETAINPDKGFYFYNDTVQEGEDIVMAIATENISPYNMDSLLVRYSHQDKNNNLNHFSVKRLRPHPAGDIIIDTIHLNTLGYPGLNSLWVEFNPVNGQTGHYDQLEQYHFNNIAQKYFYVISDKANPLLDVTFDGIHILDGDIVSAKPEILIRVKDENKYLELNDQNLFKLYIKYPDAEDWELVPFVDSLGNELLKWTPAQLPNNSCKILYTPNYEKDGIYQLMVGAKDMSGNESGDLDYYINFEVINKATITNIFNYPNPFSTSTRFVFELTGSEIPTDFQILIFTITGKLVKAIDLNDLGNIHIGRNITDYAWDGKDTYGDQLANGIYFYKVKTKLNGENIEKRDTGTDQYFKQEIGKMYLMR
ncbi:MAG: C25 family cysteine peptidase [Bacteroidota bacterium]